jgi:hypothetical protein
MKKLLIFLIILIIIGGVVFFFGWVQITVPPNHYGVIFTKTSGWQEQLVVPGQFRWEMERLLPTNFKLYLFPLGPRELMINTEGSLPSGDLYATTLTGNVDFNYSVSIFLTVRIKPANLTALVQDEGLRPNTLDKWYEDMSHRMEVETISAISEVIGSIAENTGQESSSVDAAFLLAAVENNVTYRIETVFPRLEIISVSFQDFSLPDPELYATAKSSYLEIVRSESKARAETKAKEIRKNIAATGSLDTLDRYGEILSDYPILLDYLDMTIRTDSDPLGIKDFFSNSNQ